MVDSSPASVRTTLGRNSRVSQTTLGATTIGIAPSLQTTPLDAEGRRIQSIASPGSVDVESSQLNITTSATVERAEQTSSVSNVASAVTVDATSITRYIDVDITTLATEELGTDILSTELDKRINTAAVDSNRIQSGSITSSGISYQQGVTFETTTQQVDAGNPMRPVILDSNNINIEYDRNREAFVTAWIPTFTFDDARDQLIAAVSTTEDADDISVVIERDIDNDGDAELYTDEYVIDSDIEFVHAEPEGQEGRYRLVFPRYNQDDVVETINIALTYDNTQRIIDNIPYSFISADADGDTDLDQWIAAFGLALDRFDILLDTVYDNQFADSARGGGLDDLGAALGIERRDIGNPERADDLESDARLRKRIAVARTLVGQTTTEPSFTQVLSVLYPRAIGSVNIDIKDDIPVAEVKIPQEAFQQNPLDTETTVDILNKAVASSYNIELTILGSFRFEGSAPGEGWNKGTWSRTFDFDNDANSSLYEPASEY